MAKGGQDVHLDEALVGARVFRKEPIMILGYCAICRTVKFDPQEAKVWNKGELLQLYGNADYIPKGLERTPAVFAGFQVDVQTKRYEPSFVSIESPRYKELEIRRNRNLEFQSRQRIAYCSACITIQLFTVKEICEAPCSCMSSGGALQ